MILILVYTIASFERLTVYVRTKQQFMGVFSTLLISSTFVPLILVPI